MSDGAMILVADDEQECIDFVQDALADTPHRVIAAHDGAEALAAAREHRPGLIILDVQMPQRNGFEVFAALRADEALASIPVIMLTAVAEKTGMAFTGADMGDFMESAPEAYVDKPIEPVVLVQTVNRLLAQSGA